MILILRLQIDVKTGKLLPLQMMVSQIRNKLSHC